MPRTDRPNILFVFGDQWRDRATGYGGDPDVRTPNLDRFAGESIRFRHAVSNCPVCSPWRATLMTGQYPLTHGVFVNDVPIRSNARCLGECFRDAGYETVYIGKWHIDGHGRSVYIPPERRKGFQTWMVQECTHDYSHSQYYTDTPRPLFWQGYDAFDQTRAAIRYLRGRDEHRPLLMMLSWGPPHDPYDTAPPEFRRMYEPKRIHLAPNVPHEHEQQARDTAAGYYAHCSALDHAFGELMQAIDETGQADRTVVVFTADHGDMLGSHGLWHKQVPWDESILVPMLMRWPAGFGRKSREIDDPINAPDLMPTLLGLADLPIPKTVEGKDYSRLLHGHGPAPDHAALIELPACFHQWAYWNGGRDWRGLRTKTHTYVIDHDGPWLLFDNEADPYQLRNLAGDPSVARPQANLDRDLRRRLAARGDTFRHGQDLIREAGFRVDQRGDPVYEP